LFLPYLNCSGNPLSLSAIVRVIRRKQGEKPQILGRGAEAQIRGYIIDELVKLGSQGKAIKNKGARLEHWVISDDFE